MSILQVSAETVNAVTILLMWTCVMLWAFWVFGDALFTLAQLETQSLLGSTESKAERKERLSDMCEVTIAEPERTAVEQVHEQYVNGEIPDEEFDDAVEFAIEWDRRHERNN